MSVNRASLPGKGYIKRPFASNWGIEDALASTYLLLQLTYGLLAVDYLLHTGLHVPNKDSSVDDFLLAEDYRVAGPQSIGDLKLDLERPLGEIAGQPDAGDPQFLKQDEGLTTGIVAQLSQKDIGGVVLRRLNLLDFHL